MKLQINLRRLSLLMLIFTGLCTSLSVQAQVLIDNIYYLLSEESATASVSYKKETVTRPYGIIVYESNYSGMVVIPEYVAYNNKTYKVTSIQHNAFNKCQNLTGVKIPNTVTRIGDEAFIDCSHLTDMEFSLGIESVGTKAFKNCSALKTIIPKVIRDLGEDAFSGSGIISGKTISGINYILNGNATIIPADVCAGENGQLIYNKDFSYDNKTIYLGQVISDGKQSYRVNSVGDHAFENCALNALFVYDYSDIYIAESAFKESKIDGVFLNPNLDNYDWLNQVVCGRCFVPNEDIDRIQLHSGELLPIKPEIEDKQTYLRGVSFKATCTNKYMTLSDAMTVEQLDAPDSEGKYFIKNPFFAYSALGDSQPWVALEYNIEGAPQPLSLEIVFDKKTIKDIIKVEKITQTTVTLSFDVPEDETWSLVKLTCNNETVKNGLTLTYKKLYPDRYVDFNLVAEYDMEGVPEFLDNYPHVVSESQSVLTHSLAPKIHTEEISPTHIRLSGTYLHEDAEVTGTDFLIDGKRFDGNSLSISNLDPEKDYNITYRVYFKSDTYDSYNYANVKCHTPALELVTLPAQATSHTVAVLAATTNIRDDNAATGFEWRRYDAPELVPSTQSSCPVIDGELVGALVNLSPNTYYKYRPYYTSSSNITYYGDWLAFGTADAYVYFDPTVKTYTASDISENSAKVYGYVIAGSGKISKQGFEYWIVGQDSGLASASRGEITTVEVNGTKISALLSGLKPDTSYAFRVFATTEEGTVYGEELTFTTEESSAAVFDVEIDNLQPTVVAYYDLNGRRLSNPVKGINIVIYSDGTRKKVLFKE